MQAGVEDAVVLLERVLRAVAVVDVPVEDRHSLHPKLALRVTFPVKGEHAASLAFARNAVEAVIGTTNITVRERQ